MPHRISFCITELRSGGAERCLVELATRLDRERFTCEVVSLSPRPEDSARSLVPRLEAAGVPCVFLNVLGTGSALSAVGKLARHWRGQRPDLVQTFLFHAGIVGRLAARRANVGPVVAGIRVAERRSSWRLWLDRLTAGNVARHVCVSESVATFSRDIERLPAEKLVVIPNGIDAPLYENVTPVDPASLGLAANRRFVACIGRLDAQKGQHALIDHAREWLSTSPVHDLVLVGEGPDRARLEALARERGIADRVRFVGWRNDIPAILAAADLLVLPSRWEGMPNVVLEAMAAGRAVVAFDVEGVRELLGPAAGSQVVSAEAPQVFSQSLVTLLVNAAERSRLGDANRDRVRRDFTLPAMVQRYESLYLGLINTPSGA